ncbi:hypothetical protein B005_1152 [Nocardiopsis alba ATCC BAA-2165]|uniref:Uncharacterized protein n=1 Tax=Nocardiopsis alba (strain ATCC BAA-2165 / BE74) TaxID=1205910 RepID=J7L988_NOCAA|nr:hypothetical protein B005_1152 [Nocardiopsis alba ATCC BAA-2165]
MAGLGAVAVEDGRHLTRAAGATGGALAEFRAGLGSDTYLGHDKTPRVQPRNTGNTTPLVRTILALGGEYDGVARLAGDSTALVPGVPGEPSPDPFRPGNARRAPLPALFPNGYTRRHVESVRARGHSAKSTGSGDDSVHAPQRPPADRAAPVGHVMTRGVTRTGS